MGIPEGAHTHGSGGGTPAQVVRTFYLDMPRHGAGGKPGAGVPRRSPGTPPEQDSEAARDEPSVNVKAAGVVRKVFRLSREDGGHPATRCTRPNSTSTCTVCPPRTSPPSSASNRTGLGGMI
jgi:hypothetical protein